MVITQSKKSSEARAAQDLLAIDTIRDGVILLKNGGLRTVLMASSLNFALKSTEEQDAIIYQYQNFLNSIDFSLQFVVHSRKLNILPYLDTLKDRSKEEENELLKVQIDEYIEFIRGFVELSNIVSKNFYVVVPFDPSAIERPGLLRNILGSLGLVAKKTNAIHAPSDLNGNQFTEFKNQIQQRTDATSMGLRSFGVRTVQLNTDELIELMYTLYNPGEAEAAKSTN